VPRCGAAGVVGLSLLVLALTSAVVMSSDVVNIGEEAEEALLGIDDLSTRQAEATAPQDAELGDLGDSATISDQGMARNQQEGLPIDLNSIGHAVKPRELQPKADPEADAKAQKVVEAFVEKLKEAQNEAIDAEVKADDKEREADEMARLATVKDDKPKQVVLKRENRLRKVALAQRKKADALAKKAQEMKMAFKEQIKAKLEKEETKFSKAHFAATKAEVERAEALTKAHEAKKPKPESLNPCDVIFEKSTQACVNTTKTNEAKKGTDDEMDPGLIKAQDEECKKTAEEVQMKCKKARVAEMSSETAAAHTLQEYQKAFNSRKHAMALAAALASYKDVEKPKKPDGPVGLFQYKGLVYFANKDGTRTWVRYPTYKCHRATAGVVPQQFPVSKEVPEFDKRKSETYCEMGIYKGLGNPDFYKNCECSGMSNKKNHGAFCDKWGYQFNWCYVSRECGYGNTAYSDELKDTKVLVGCRIHPPAIDP